MSNKKLTIIGVSLLSLSLLIIFASYKQQAQIKPEIKRDEATEVQRGRFSSEEKAYSKEYNKLYADYHGLNLDLLIEIGKRKNKSEIVGTSIGIPFSAKFPQSVQKTPTRFLINLSCKSDAVVVGSIEEKSAHLTENEKFIYTQYKFFIEDIVKNNSVLPIAINERISVTRPGGTIKINNQLIQAEDKSYAPLEPNKKYLLFLKFVPEAKGYMVADINGDFVLKGSSFAALSETISDLDFREINDFDALVNNARSLALADCNGNAGGKK